MSLQLASTMRTDFIVWECHCCLLEILCTQTVCCGGWCFLTRYTDTLQEENAATWYMERNDETNKHCKVLVDWTTNNLQQYNISILPQIFQHGYTKREKSAAYQQEWEAAVSDTHDTSQALIQVDFSEKHTCVAKDKIQGAHWEQHWVSLSTVHSDLALWFHSLICDRIALHRTCHTSFWNDVTWDRQAKREDGLEQSTNLNCPRGYVHWVPTL